MPLPVHLALSFLLEEDGPTAVEYAIMLLLIIIVVFATVQYLGQQSSTAFSTVGSSISSAAN